MGRIWPKTPRNGSNTPQSWSDTPRFGQNRPKTQSPTTLQVQSKLAQHWYRPLRLSSKCAQQRPTPRQVWRKPALICWNEPERNDFALRWSAIIPQRGLGANLAEVGLISVHSGPYRNKSRWSSPNFGQLLSMIAQVWPHIARVGPKSTNLSLAWAGISSQIRPNMARTWPTGSASANAYARPGVSRRRFRGQKSTHVGRLAEI